MTVIEGSLTIDMTINRHGANRVAIQSTRPVHACRVFHGRHYSDALQMLPLLFSICGVAQACAGVRASEQALSIPVPTMTQQVRDALVSMETLREHLWRLLLEWPLFIGQAEEKSAMAEMLSLQRDYQQTVDKHNSAFTVGASALQLEPCRLSALQKRLNVFLQKNVFAMPAAQWLMFSTIEELTEWAEAQQTVAARLLHYVLTSGWAVSGACQSEVLPLLDRQILNQAMADEAYVQYPQWSGHCCETSSLSRRESPLLNALEQEYGNGLLVRLTARLTEIAQLSVNIQAVMELPLITGNETLPEGLGIGQTAAARGQLVHRVKIVDEQIQHYQILAPTEWNFHPDGVLVQALAALQGDSAMIEQQARLLINAIDPCVTYQLHITG